MQPRITILVNESSGSSRVGRAAVADACAQAQVNASVEVVEPGQLLAAAERAVTESDTVVAAGGDGTVSTVASVAVRTGTTLGVIPLGTLNHFARDARIPIELDKAIAVIAAGQTALLDVGAVNGRTFVNNASLGIYPRLVWEREIERSRGRRRWTAFAVALVRTWRRYPTVTVQLVMGTTRLVRSTPFVFVGNGNYRAAGLAIGTRDSLTTGRVSVFYAAELDRVELLTLPLRALGRRLDTDAHFHCAVVEEFSIDALRPALDVAIDGELTALTAPLHFTTRPRSLRVLVPHDE